MDHMSVRSESQQSVELEVGNRYGHSCENFDVQLFHVGTDDLSEGERNKAIGEAIVRETEVLFEGFLEDLKA